MPAIDIIIVNWNSGEHLRRCIDSVLQFGGGLVSKIVVVDNDSTDGSDAAVQGLPGVDLIRAGANLGFARACNLGATRCDSSYFLFLNPDTELFASTLPDVHAFLESGAGKGIGICGITLIGPDGKPTTSAARFPTLAVIAGRIFGLSRLFPGVFPPHLLTAKDLRESSVVDQVIGAFFLVRSDVFSKYLGFDERFFLYYEEVDFSLRAKRGGHDSYYFSKASAFHRGGACSDRVKALRLFYSLRSRLLYVRKHFSWAGRITHALLLTVECGLRFARALLSFSMAEIRETSTGYRHLARHILTKGRG